MLSRSRVAMLVSSVLVVTACAGAGPTNRPSSAASQAARTSTPSTAVSSGAPTTGPSSGTSSGAPTTGPSTEPSSGPSSPDPSAGGTACDNLAQGSDDQLARICGAGEIRVSTDPEYPPQSFLDDAGEYVGFDIDVSREIAERLGVEVRFEAPSFRAVVSGSWSDRWDMSVGSVTITPERQDVLDFTQTYYFTPAQLATTEGTGIESIDDFAGVTVCVAEATTYLDWLEGSLVLPDDAGEVTPAPEGITGTTLPTDINCAEAWRSGRRDFDGWLSSSTTVQGAIDGGLPVIAVGDPVFFEPLAVAFDKGVDDNDSLVAAVDAIIGEMHADGTLTALSMQWYDGLDLTTR